MGWGEAHSDPMGDIRRTAEAMRAHPAMGDPNTLLLPEGVERHVRAAAEDQGAFLGECTKGCGAWATNAVPYVTLWATTRLLDPPCRHELPS